MQIFRRERRPKIIYEQFGLTCGDWFRVLLLFKDFFRCRGGILKDFYSSSPFFGGLELLISIEIAYETLSAFR